MITRRPTTIPLKSGQEIFEGDVVQLQNNGTRIRGVVCWFCGSWWIRGFDSLLKITLFEAVLSTRSLAIIGSVNEMKHRDMLDIMEDNNETDNAIKKEYCKEKVREEVWP